MTVNESSVDRIIRAVVGVALLAAWVFGWIGGTLAVVLGVVAIVLVVTAAVGFCPLYRIFGMSTCPVPAKR
ncbi:MAG: DUF2892 domain-containing protein [Trueperaceae bacterium]|nr:DUF2892 domain-containing protein [Trueperaceae bacterium]